MPNMGPIEAVAARLAELEAALGVKPREEKSRRRQGRLGPGGRRLLGWLRRGELDRQEQDMLGAALQADQTGKHRKAQECLDMLARGHRLRLAVEKARIEGGERS
jgi:hypothetical protein